MAQPSALPQAVLPGLGHVPVSPPYRMVKGFRAGVSSSGHVEANWPLVVCVFW